jgi:hypothetical protein
MKFGTRPRSHIEPAGVEKLLSCSSGEMGEAPAMGKEVKLTDEDLSNLRSLPVTVYSPGRDTFERYAPLAGKGLLTDRDVGSDEAQETIMRIELTPAGRTALEANRE